MAAQTPAERFKAWAASEAARLRREAAEMTARADAIDSARTTFEQFERQAEK